MTRKTVSRHLANLIGLTICQSAPRRRAHLVVTALLLAPWLLPLVLLRPPFLSLRMPGHLQLPHQAHVVTWLLEVVSAALVAVVASVETMRLAAGEALVAQAIAEAEAVAHLQVATAVGRAMSSVTSKTSRRTRAHLRALADPFPLKALQHLSAKTAILPPPHTLALKDSGQTAKPFPILRQVLELAFLPLEAHLHLTVVQLNHQFQQVPATLV